MNGPDWLGFPSLAGLRAYEAAARLGGFSAAGRALSVTHAAVAQQVRALEREIGESLVVREGRALRLTEKGEALAAELTRAFVAIQSATEAARAQSDRPVAITLSPSFAANWLMPRLGRFWRAHPDIQLSLQPDHRVVDLAREGFDLGIRFGRGKWPGVEARHLAPAHYVVVATPALLGGRTALTTTELAAMTWVLEPDWPEHRHWLSTQTGLDVASLKMQEFATDELALGAARQGLGLHVSSYALVEDDLRAGRLCIAFAAKGDDLGYFVVTSPGPQRPQARTFLRWLMAES
ncbi:MAG: LysR family transcriptional regulator [Proteobacteria bacterium]|nr:LysR family transcriptional regulator [Pseudomonadota bacterium]